MKRTPLYDEHIALNAKMVDFAGWEMPIEYTSLFDEHNYVREDVGIFDVSHMGEFRVQGKDAQKFVNYILSNDVSQIKDGQILYTFFLNEKGGVVDDLLVYKVSEANYYLVVNAANIEKDWKWITSHSDNYNVQLINESDITAEVALQGPKAESLLQEFVNIDLKKLTFFTFSDECELSGIPVLISRTGYTGEDGFEIYSKNEDIIKIWEILLKAGAKPCALGARDTLRFEAALPLYGHELSDEISPLEAGFGFFVKLQKESDFIGKAALVEQKQEGLKRKIVGLQMMDRGIAREGTKVFSGEKEVGWVTTGYKSPTIGLSISNALLEIQYTEMGTELEVDIRGRRKKVKVISKQFLKNYRK